MEKFKEKNDYFVYYHESRWSLPTNYSILVSTYKFSRFQERCRLYPICYPCLSSCFWLWGGFYFLSLGSPSFFFCELYLSNVVPNPTHICFLINYVFNFKSEIFQLKKTFTGIFLFHHYGKCSFSFNTIM